MKCPKCEKPFLKWVDFARHLCYAHKFAFSHCPCGTGISFRGMAQHLRNQKDLKAHLEPYFQLQEIANLFEDIAKPSQA